MRKKKWMVSILVVIILIGISKVWPVEILPCGVVMTSIDNVPAHSNGAYQGSTTGSNCLGIGSYGRNPLVRVITFHRHR